MRLADLASVNGRKDLVGLQCWAGRSVPTLWGLYPIHSSVKNLQEVNWLEKEIKSLYSPLMVPATPVESSNFSPSCLPTSTAVFSPTDSVCDRAKQGLSRRCEATLTACSKQRLFPGVVWTLHVSLILFKAHVDHLAGVTDGAFKNRGSGNFRSQQGGSKQC